MWFQNLCCGRSFVLLGTVQSSTNTMPIDDFDIKAGVQQACVFMPLFSYVLEVAQVFSAQVFSAHASFLGLCVGVPCHCLLSRNLC